MFRSSKRSNSKVAKRLRTKWLPGEEHLLEARLMLTNPWHNESNPLNVDGSSGASLISPIDALLVINELNNPLHSDPLTHALSERNRPDATNPTYLDVNNDLTVSALDALLVINHLNSPPQALEGTTAVSNDRLLPLNALGAVEQLPSTRFSERVLDGALKYTQQRPALASTSAGFVAAWESDGQDGSGKGIFGRIFSVDGTPLSEEFRINSFVRNDQRAPKIDALSDGRFVVTWESESQDGSGSGVYARMFDPSGKPTTSDLLINRTTSGTQKSPDIAVISGDRFAIAWEGKGTRNPSRQDSYGVFVRIFGSDGKPLTDEYRVNDQGHGYQSSVAIESDPTSGEFFVVWQGAGPSDDNGIYLRRFRSTGVPAGHEQSVNRQLRGEQSQPALAVDSDSRLVVAWASIGNESTQGWDVFFQQFDADGRKFSDETKANSFVRGTQWHPSVSYVADEGFVVGWVGAGSDDASGVHLRQFESTGAIGPETRISSTTRGTQENLSIEFSDSGVVTAWSGQGVNDSQGVFAASFLGRGVSDEVPLEERSSAGIVTASGASVFGFNPVNSPIDFHISGATIASNEVQVFRNGFKLPRESITTTSNSIRIASAFVEGRNEFVVLAVDTRGLPLTHGEILWAGSQDLAVDVLDDKGKPFSELVTIRASLADDQRVFVESTGTGTARIANVPDRTILLEARSTTSNAFGLIGTTGRAGSVQLRMLPFKASSNIDNNDFSLGTDGWDIGSSPVEIVPHVEGVPIQQNAKGPVNAIQAAAINNNLVLSTSGEGEQSISRTFNVSSDTQSVRVRYRFITSEVPGGYFGSKYNDYFRVTLRTFAAGDNENEANSMNGLGLTSFDFASGSTSWREKVISLSSMGDRIQVDVGVANVADGLYDSSVEVDVVEEVKLEIESKPIASCPDESVELKLKGDPAGTVQWTVTGPATANPASSTEKTFATRFPMNGDYAITATLTDSNGGKRSATTSIHVSELSGAQWVSRFPTSTSVNDLATGFAGNVSSFISALQAAGATVGIAATYRPEQRAFLMHYAYRVANEGLDPTSVPRRDDIDICWTHRNADGTVNLADSRSAAQAMVSGYGIAYPPALTSRHTERLAIDMNISWTGDLKIKRADGTETTITSSPRNGSGNADLHSVGAGYGVNKLAGDPPHWSSDGH